MFTRAIDRLIVRRVFSRVLGDAVRVGFGDDPVQPRSVGASQPSLVVHDAGRLLSAMLAEGAVGFAVAYMEGAWTTADLAGVLQAASMRIDARDDADSRTRWRGRWADNVRDSHDPRIREIGEHYDLGNEFYAAWLDASMSYSSAIFTDPSESLEHAQARKYERLCALVDLRPGDRVLEIGCGWGGFAHYAVEHHDVTVTGLTLSRRQAAYAVERIASAGLGDRARIRLLDFRDVAGTYDKVVSIEMIESVDETLWPPLFETIHRVLVPGGLAAMQAIVIDERYYESLLQRDDFIKRFIFPGGALPA
ncbi:MAG: class I SAM-dependent methyltransferase, partial [Acidimicrobiia bacterium]|nr:class I SAM-dependent methyltransferase [Acidimicrobiia bacterium]